MSEIITLKKEVSFDFPVSILKKTERAGEFHVVGYAATTDFDLQGDIISEEALKSSSIDLTKNSTVLLNHDNENPIGKVTKCEFDQHGLLIDALISKTEPDIIEKIKEGVLNKFSIRGQVIEREREYNKELDRTINVIKRMTLLEVSLVSVPANPEARAVGWYISKALNDSDQGGQSMSKNQSKEEPKKKGEEPELPLMKQESAPQEEPKPETPPQPEPQKPQEEPKPIPEAPKPQETKKNLQEALKAALEPVFERLGGLMKMDGDVRQLSQEIWMKLKEIVGEDPMPMPEMKPASLSGDEIGKMVQAEVKKEVSHIMESMPALRKGVIQKETESADLEKTFESLPSDQKLRVALAMQQR